MLEIVLARLEVHSRALEALARLLSADELARAARLHARRHRDRFVAARGTLRRLVGERTGEDPRAVAFVYGASGKPALENGALHFNVSHSEDLALYAFSGAEVGVDVEAVREVPEADRLAREWFDEDEYRRYGFLGCWTRREALAKASGRGIAEAVDASGWRVRGFSPAPGYVAAVAARSSR